jgi:hypothetical protein
MKEKWTNSKGNFGMQSNKTVKDREPAVEMKRPTYSSRGLKTQSMD